MIATKIKYHPKRRFCKIAILCISIVASFEVSAQQDVLLMISAGGVPVSGSSPSHLQYFSGSDAQFRIGIHELSGRPLLREYRGQTASWPHGLSIHVSTADGISHDEWLSEMYVHPFIGWDEALTDSLWRADGREPSEMYKSETYSFIFTIPDAAAGQDLILSARFEHPEFGHLETADSAKMQIVAPQTEEDRFSIWNTKIFYTYVSRDYERTTVLADSLVAQGFTGLRGLDCAQRAAKRLGQYCSALQYLDLSMEVNGAFSETRENEVPKGISKEETIKILRSRYQNAYNQLRNEYLQKIEAQQQQQR